VATGNSSELRTVRFGLLTSGEVPQVSSEIEQVLSESGAVEVGDFEFDTAITCSVLEVMQANLAQLRDAENDVPLLLFDPQQGFVACAWRKCRRQGRQLVVVTDDVTTTDHCENGDADAYAH
jgi:hypothetical protein